MRRPDRVKAHLVHVGHARNGPFADVAVKRRLCGPRCRGGHRGIEQARYPRICCDVPVRDRTVRCRRRRRVGHPCRRGRGDVCVGDGRQHIDMGGQHEEQSEAGEKV